ncbi:hypothetical protein ACJJTC_006819 [Scirpophaga incertulas]
MYYKCCVRGCSNTRKDAVLHRFPTNENRLNLWLRCLSNDELDVSYLHNLFMCEKHFEKRFIGARSRLLMDAYPTLFTADEISTGIPQVCNETSNNNDPFIDHTYNRKRHLDHTYCKEESSAGISCSPVLRRKILSPIQQDITDSNMNESDAGVTKNKITSLVGKTICKKRLIGKFQTLSATAKRIYMEYKKSKSQAKFHARAKSSEVFKG